MNEPNLKPAEINVETFNGIVQLSGFVTSRADIVKAVEVARDVNGCRWLCIDAKAGRNGGIS